MPMKSSAVGLRLKPWTGTVDARWIMAYASALGNDDAVYIDTTNASGVTAHPVFPVAPEWAQLIDPDSGIDIGLTMNEAHRGVHASHDLHWHRPLTASTAADRRIVIEAEITAMQTTSAGALLTMRFDASEVSGAPLWTTWMRSMYRGVEIEGPDAQLAAAPLLPAMDAAAQSPLARRTVDLSPVAGIVYNECARVFNPIHSDRAIAVAAGLPQPILHGSATFAHGVDAALAYAEADAGQVARLGASFRAMVPFPGTATVEILEDRRDDHGRTVAFQVRNDAGEVAVRDAFVVLR